MFESQWVLISIISRIISIGEGNARYRIHPYPDPNQAEPPAAADVYGQTVAPDRLAVGSPGAAADPGHGASRLRQEHIDQVLVGGCGSPGGLGFFGCAR
jgi:hypothetical protein